MRKFYHLDEHQLPSVETILGKGLAEARDWLASVNSSELYSHVNWWLGFAYSASLKAFFPIDDQVVGERFEWARIAITAYENVDKFKAGGCRDCVEKAMALRVRLINLIGARADENLLDLQVIENWFINNLKLSLEQVAQISQLALKTLWDDHREMFAEARQTKERLGIVSHLDDIYINRLSETTRNWLKVKHLLP
jgi:hypothetical protein